MMYKRRENGEQVTIVKSMEGLGCTIIDLIPFNYKSLRMSNEEIIEAYEINNNIIIENNFKKNLISNLETKRQEVLFLVVKLVAEKFDVGGIKCIQ